jgi:hypothetical protein
MAGSRSYARELTWVFDKPADNGRLFLNRSRAEIVGAGDTIVVASIFSAAKGSRQWHCDGGKAPKSYRFIIQGIAFASAWRACAFRVVRRVNWRTFGGIMNRKSRILSAALAIGGLTFIGPASFGIMSGVAMAQSGGSGAGSGGGGSSTGGNNGGNGGSSNGGTSNNGGTNNGGSGNGGSNNGGTNGGSNNGGGDNGSNGGNNNGGNNNGGANNGGNNSGGSNSGGSNSGGTGGAGGSGAGH